MRKYIKRIFLALALAGTLAAGAQPLFATDKKIQQNEPDRIFISAPLVSIEPAAPDPWWNPRGWLGRFFGAPQGAKDDPPTTPPTNNDFGDGKSGEEVLKALK